MPTPGALLCAIVFGAVGMAAFVYAKKTGSIRRALIGVALMAYPYFISQTWLLLLIGFILTGWLLLGKE